MKGSKRLTHVTPLFECAAIALDLAAYDSACVLAPLRLPLLRLVSFEESREYKISEEPHFTELELRLVPQIAQLTVGDGFIRLADESAYCRDPLQVLADAHCLEARLKARCVRVPVEGLDLLTRKPDQGIPVPKRMVHKGERVVLRQCHEPERHLG